MIKKSLSDLRAKLDTMKKVKTVFKPTTEIVVGNRPYEMLTTEQKAEVDKDFSDWSERKRYKFDKRKDLKTGRTWWSCDTGGKIPIL